jgi:tetratricopeptide (TPR) repeat protein
MNAPKRATEGDAPPDERKSRTGGSGRRVPQTNASRGPRTEGMGDERIEPRGSTAAARRAEFMQVERGKIVLHQHLVQTADGPLALTPIERQLLQYLSERPRQVVPLEEILEAVWGYAPTSRSQAVHVAIRRLRRKLEVDPANPKHLKTVAGAGWVFEPAEGPPRTLLGRDADLRRVEAALAASHRVCLTGAAGVGKTALALALGGDPVVELVSATRLDEALLLMARALRCDLGQLHDRLSSRPTILLLDQAEHLAADLARWLDQVPGSLRCLITSRVPIPGTRRLALDPLDVDAAAALFHRRTSDLGRDTTGADEAEAVRAIVDLLGGNPLAIELAAARTRLFAPAVLLDQLRRDPSTLLGSETTGMLATLQWSWDLLTADQRRALCRLAAFAGGFDAESAAAVIVDPEQRSHVGPVLEQLLDQGLLRVSGERFGLLQLVRAFVQRVGAPAELASGRERHARWFARAGDPSNAGALEGPSSTEALIAALPDLELAAGWAIAARDAACAASLCFAWAEASRTVGGAEALLGRVQEAMALEGADSDCAASGDMPGSATVGRAPRRRHGDCIATLSTAAGIAQARCGAGAEAIASLRRAAAAATGHRLPSLVLTFLAPMEALAADHAAASRSAAEAVRHARASGVGGLLVGALNAAALVAEAAGDRASALARVTEACRALEAAGGHRAHRAALDVNRATFLDGIGRRAEARAVWESTLPTLDETNPEGAAIVRNNLAHALWELDEPEAAAEMARFAVQIHRSHGDRHHQTAPLALLARLSREAGRVDEARAQLGAALTLARDCEQGHLVVVLLTELANLELDQGRPPLAEPLLQEALARATTGSEEILACAVLARSRAAEGRVGEARDLVARAEAIPREGDLEIAVARALDAVRSTVGPFEPKV